MMDGVDMRRRREEPVNPAGALQAMKICRDAMLVICRQVKPMGVMYHGASMVIAAIDALARLLTGQPDYFSISGSVPAKSSSASAEHPGRSSCEG